MRVEPPVFDAIYSAPPVIQPGSEAAREDEDKKEDKTQNSDYMYALSTGSIINVQV
ncbi:hypothetical protein LEP1GSC047_2525 [Leptospira inadai serovar Lyme str. 10]|uniref:Uncharacterized protein n=2 Tax=Leptospira inadai TaxID=29506 RepID=V6HC74_9LEPT|nr:hypothetical protein LEP1GSC047_2525 [Leptospira inadai serovar Lyme str. 10]